MTCASCSRDTTSLVPDASGLLTPMCDECKARVTKSVIGVPCSICEDPTQAFYPDRLGAWTVCELCHRSLRDLPVKLADGTQPGNRSRWVAMTEQISVEQARVEACKEVLRHLVQSFARELSAGYTTPEQQSALRRAKELIG